MWEGMRNYEDVHVVILQNESNESKAHMFEATFSPVSKLKSCVTSLIYFETNQSYLSTPELLTILVIKFEQVHLYYI